MKSRCFSHPPALFLYITPRSPYPCPAGQVPKTAAHPGISICLPNPDCPNHTGRTQTYIFQTTVPPADFQHKGPFRTVILQTALPPGSYPAQRPIPDSYSPIPVPPAGVLQRIHIQHRPHSAGAGCRLVSVFFLFITPRPPSGSREGGATTCLRILIVKIIRLWNGIPPAN